MDGWLGRSTWADGNVQDIAVVDNFDGDPARVLGSLTYHEADAMPRAATFLAIMSKWLK
jgi:hypothetical protein